MERIISANKTLDARLRTVSIFRTLGLPLEATSEGKATLTAPYDPRCDRIFKSFPGGLLMTLANIAACEAVLMLAGVTALVTTTDMNIRFLTPCRSDCTAEATVIKLGKTLVPASVSLSDKNGTRIAVAQVTYMLLGEKKVQISEE